MENGQLISLSHQMALKRRMDVIANNIANVGTAGYRSDSLRFEEFIMPVARAGGMEGASARLSYVQEGGVVRDFSQGELAHTGNELDVAISGDGWFVVQTPDGERYTRNGEFKLDAQGRLVTGSGLAVLGESGPITFSNNETGIEIAKDGTISTTAGTRGKFRIVRFEDNQALTKAGATNFTTTAQAEPATGVRVMQGMVEKSNVQPVLELTHMIETVRAYTRAAQIIQNSEDIRRDALDRLSEAGNT